MNPISFLSLASKTAKAYESFCRPVCKKHRINQTCLDVILFLANNPEYNTARDLCELRGIRSGNASVAIDTLAGRGLLTRQADPNDRRITRLVLMPEAEPIVADGREIIGTRTADLCRHDSEAWRQYFGYAFLIISARFIIK